MRLLLFIIVALSPMLFSPLAMASPWAVNKENIVMDGYDPVAYFIENKAVKGEARYAQEWDDAIWWFKSEANRERFRAAPQNYAPQFGAHCANGLSDGHVVHGNPENWRIIDGKLYLFFSAWGRAQWMFMVEEQIQEAKATWSSYLSELADKRRS